MHRHKKRSQLWWSRERALSPTISLVSTLSVTHIRFIAQEMFHPRPVSHRWETGLGAVTRHCAMSIDGRCDGRSVTRVTRLWVDIMAPRGGCSLRNAWFIRQSGHYSQELYRTLAECEKTECETALVLVTAWQRGPKRNSGQRRNSVHPLYWCKCS